MNELMEILHAYLNDEISLDDLESWLVINLQDFINVNDAETMKIVDELDADLVEYGMGTLEEIDVYERVREYLIELDAIDSRDI